MVHLYADVTCRTLAVEDIDFDILAVLQAGTDTNTQVGLGHLRQCCETRLEVLFLTFHLELEATGQRHVAQSRYKDSLRHCVRIGRNGVRQLIDVAEQTSIKQQLLHVLTRQFGDVLHTKVLELLLSISIYPYAEHLSSVTTLHGRYRTADRRGKLDSRVVLVDEQCVTGQDLVTFLDDDLWNDTFEIIGYQSVLPT